MDSETASVLKFLIVANALICVVLMVGVFGIYIRGKLKEWKELEVEMKSEPPT